MPKVGKLPNIPTPDAFRRALGKLRFDKEAKHSENEVAQFVELVRVALEHWPSEVPVEFLEVVHANEGYDSGPTGDYSILSLRGGVFEAIAGVDQDGEGIDASEQFAVASLTKEQNEEYEDLFSERGWRGAIVFHDSYNWFLSDEVQRRAFDAEGDLPSWARKLANTVLRVERKVHTQRVSGGDDEPYGTTFERELEGALGRNLGGGADWSVDAWRLEGSGEQGSIFLLRDDDGWMVVQRYSGERLDGEIPDDVQEEIDESGGNDVILTLLGPVGNASLIEWAHEQPVEAHTEPARDNPRGGKVFFVHDGENEHGPITLKSMCTDNAEHPDLCAALKKMKAGQELHVGGGAQPVFVIRCEKAGRDNPHDEHEHEHGHDDHMDCGEVPPEDESRINPVSEAEMQQIIDHLSTEAITEVQRCLDMFNLGHLIESGRVEVAFTRGGFSALGRCAYRQGNIRITLNALAWPRIAEDERYGTLRHESAHAVDYLQHGSSSHGPRWKKIARAMGDSGERVSEAVDIRTGLPVGHALRAESRGETPAPVSHGRNFRIGENVEFTNKRGQVIRGRVQSVNRKTITLDNRWRVPPILLRPASGARANPTEAEGELTPDEHRQVDGLILRKGNANYSFEDFNASADEFRLALSFASVLADEAIPSASGDIAKIREWIKFVPDTHLLGEKDERAVGHVAIIFEGLSEAADEIMFSPQWRGIEDQIGGGHIGSYASYAAIVYPRARRNPDGEVVVCEQHGWRHAPDEECAKCVEDREGPRDNPSGQAGGKTRVQSLVFDAGTFSPSSAKSWAKGHGFSATKTDKRDNTIRIRQDDPAYYAEESFRTISLAEGVQAVIGQPRD